MKKNTKKKVSKSKSRKALEKKTNDTLNRLVLYYMVGVWK